MNGTAPSSQPEQSQSLGIKTDARARRCNARGFTLAESLIASVVLAACVIGIGATLGASYQNNRYLNENTAATALARQMMEQIISRSYVDGPGTSDSIYDYRDCNWSSASSITLANGTTIDLPGGGQYTRYSKVEYFNTLDDIEGTAQSNLNPLPPVAVVTVNVTTPTGKVIALVQIVAGQ
ncbi:MAG: hypothetical protein IT448_00515 [Phycisphaerales bacterium]|nr:hypothetical protein [Phycisphaerales bacterium]